MVRRDWEYGKLAAWKTSSLPLGCKMGKTIPACMGHGRGDTWRIFPRMEPGEWVWLLTEKQSQSRTRAGARRNRWLRADKELSHLDIVLWRRNS
jgi:hypothetical protein